MSMYPLDNNIIAFGVPVQCEDGVRNLIELVNFAHSARIQTLRTRHTLPMVILDYSPDSEQVNPSSLPLISRRPPPLPNPLPMSPSPISLARHPPPCDHPSPPFSYSPLPFGLQVTP